jgi:hypothetical protein
LNAILQLGIDLERVGEPDDPLEGSNVTLICTNYYKFFSDYYYYYDYYYSRVVTTWFYYANWDATWYELSEDFLKESNAGIKH